MMRHQLLAACTILFGTLHGSMAFAADISTKKLLIKDMTDINKRKVQVKSKDLNIHFTDAVDPGTNGALLHVYSTTDDFCAVFPGGTGWTNKGTLWKFKDKAT